MYNDYDYELPVSIRNTNSPKEIEMSGDRTDEKFMSGVDRMRQQWMILEWEYATPPNFLGLL